MERIGFLRKLKKRKLISLVKPSENLEKAHLELSEKFFLSAELLLKNNFLESATSDFYYSMYHLLLALLFKCGIKSENHNASIYFLDYLFGRKDLCEVILSAKRERIDKQYYPKTKIAKNEVEGLMERAKFFNLEIRKLMDSISQEDIKELRGKFMQI